MTDEELKILFTKLATAIQAHTMLRISNVIREESLKAMVEAFGPEILEKLK